MSAPRNLRESVVWVPGMKLGPGKPHDARFEDRILNARRVVGNGTVDDPMIFWVRSTKYPDSESKFKATEAIVRKQLQRIKLPFAWIVAEGHGTSTVGWSEDGYNTRADDDNHITLRMGIDEDTCNLSGHLYIIYEENNPKKRAIRMMEERERTIIGGRNPQFYVWGFYPRKDMTTIKYPSHPFTPKPAPIIDIKKPFNGSFTKPFVDTALPNPSIAVLLHHAHDSTFISFDSEFNAIVGPSPHVTIAASSPEPFAFEAGIWVPPRNQIWFTAYLDPTPGFLTILDLNTSKAFQPTLTGTLTPPLSTSMVEEVINSFHGLPLNGPDDVTVSMSRTTKRPCIFYSD
ncbi:hypothetical protein F5Y16DRAFT_398881 [Xylariaceae sp. FL0255]|nr:hypothetical protein F5Y16DRAFT_398881 [Xylariaceae sp. FL0255]